MTRKIIAPTIESRQEGPVGRPYEDSIAFWEVIGNIAFPMVQARRLQEVAESVETA